MCARINLNNEKGRKNFFDFPPGSKVELSDNLSRKCMQQKGKGNQMTKVYKC